MTSPLPETNGFKRFLPRIGSPGYHLLLAAVAIFILGPLGGISAAFMNFSIGFYVGWLVAQADAMPTWNAGDEFEAARKKALSR